MLSVPMVTGPTAVGKTELGIELALALGGEIISADARQIYRGLDVGTAKPPEAERARAPHHFVDELDPRESFSSGAFARAAEDRIREIARRGRTPIVVGGSTLYIEALVKGFADIPRVDPAVRESLKARLEREGAEQLYCELAAVDPEAAATMDPTKSQRIVRALEVYHGTGRHLSHYHRHHVAPLFSYRGVVLERDRQQLYDRIDRRVDWMLSEGLIEEVRSLLDSGVNPQANALRTIGYREVVGYLSGDYSQAEMIRLLKRNTRRYAKRQITWFKRYPDFRRVPADIPVAELVGLLGG